MSAEPNMRDENLYVVFPEGLAAGRTAHVLGTWTEDRGGVQRAKLALINYTCRLIIPGTAVYEIDKEDGRFGLGFVVVSGESGEEVNVRLTDLEEEYPQGFGTLYKLE